MELTSKERLDLKRLLTQSDCEDNTDYLRGTKHSSNIRKGVEDLVHFLQKTSSDCQLSPEEFEQQAQAAAPFLFINYTDLFVRIMKNELDLSIMDRVLQVLAAIEEGQVNQHEGSVVVGRILKEMYLDSAIRRGEHLDEQHAQEKPAIKEGKPISWTEFKGKNKE